MNSHLTTCPVVFPLSNIKSLHLGIMNILKKKINERKVIPVHARTYKEIVIKWCRSDQNKAESKAQN